jgi:hypothetical protein
MMLSLQQAADLARVNKSTLFRAIKSGKVSASRDEHGQWRLDPAEVSRVYPIAVEDAGQQHAIPRKRDRTDELVSLLQGQLAQMGKELERVRIDAETWRNAFETERTQRLALPSPPAAGPPWWRALRWMRKAG